MLFKVFYQRSIDEVPVRENTESLYIEAENEREVRNKLAGHRYHIEFIKEVNGAFLEYERRSDHFKVENL